MEYQMTSSASAATTPERTPSAASGDGIAGGDGGGGGGGGGANRSPMHKGASMTPGFLRRLTSLEPNKMLARTRSLSSGIPDVPDGEGGGGGGGGGEEIRTAGFVPPRTFLFYVLLDRL